MEQQQGPAPTVRLRGGDGEEFEVDAPRLAALFRTHVFSVPAIDSIAVFNLLVVYLKLQARGWHTAPLVERCFVRTIGDYGTLTCLASAARHLGMDDLLNLCLRATVVLLQRARAAKILQNLQIQEEY